MNPEAYAINEEAKKLLARIAELEKALEHYVDAVTLAIPDWWDYPGMGRYPEVAELEKRDIGEVARVALGINDVVNEAL